MCCVRRSDQNPVNRRSWPRDIYRIKQMVIGGHGDTANMQQKMLASNTTARHVVNADMMLTYSCFNA